MSSKIQREWEHLQERQSREAIHGELTTIRGILSSQNVTVCEPDEIIFPEADMSGIEASLEGMHDLLGNIDASLEDVAVSMREGFENVCRGQRRMTGVAMAIGVELVLQREELQSIRDGIWGLHDLVDEVGMAVAGVEGAVREQTAEIVDALQDLDRNADVRHNELLQAIRSRLRNEAGERYAEAMRQYNAGFVGSALTAINRGLVCDSTHPQLWMLLARCCYRRTRYAAAMEALSRAAKYAVVNDEKDAYEAAILRASRLMRLLGNTNAANRIVVNAISRAPKLWEHKLWAICFEWSKIQWRRAFQLTDSACARHLDGVIRCAAACLMAMPSLAHEVNRGALTKDFIKQVPSIRHIDAPLAKLGHELATLRLSREVVPGHPCKDGDCRAKLAIPLYENQLEKLLVLCRFGKNIDMESECGMFLQDVSTQYLLLRQKFHGFDPGGPAVKAEWCRITEEKELLVSMKQLSEHYGWVLLSIVEYKLLHEQMTCSEAFHFFYEKEREWKKLTNICLDEVSDVVRKSIAVIARGSVDNKSWSYLKLHYTFLRLL